MGVITASADDYTNQLEQLLPQGPAWPRDSDSPHARAFPPAGASMATVHARLNQLIEEADARTTSELLVDFERVVGLPDPCLDPPTSTAERRRRVVQRLTYQGGQSVAFFVGLLAALGYPGATVKEYRPFRAFSKCNASLNQGGWRYGWTVNVPASVNVKVMTCVARCNDPLASWGNPGLECLLAAHKPAHTRLFVGYGV
ncbi:YmfQ family protein [Variovorax sp. RCC_210]|uniref:YmfQ family protein n=1 Tax=Variovorax sp. RCC_210 TaxID=3239217 RepID=UPI003526732C